MVEEEESEGERTTEFTLNQLGEDEAVDSFKKGSWCGRRDGLSASFDRPGASVCPNWTSFTSLLLSADCVP